jgi:hypothetical protein
MVADFFFSCVTFGNSGSTLVRKDDEQKFRWIGPLSMSKGYKKYFYGE